MQTVNVDQFPFKKKKKKEKGKRKGKGKEKEGEGGEICMERMTLLSTKPIARAYSMITLGIEMLNSFFSFHSVKFFLHLYKISEVAFYQDQVRRSPSCPFS